MSTPSRITKSAPAPGDAPAQRLEDMDTHFVSLVTAGANRQNKFLVVKALTCPKCGAVFKPSVENPGMCPKCGAVLPPMAEAPTGEGPGEPGQEDEMMAASKKGQTAKAEVPDASATPEEKRAAQDARAAQYGIPALAVGSALSYPANGPTVASLYADPVNLKYPMAYDDNKLDAARTRNAAARFAQAADAYPTDAARGKVWGNIVEAELKLGVAHSANALDALLPADVKAKLEATQKTAKQSAAAAPTGSSEGAPTAAIAVTSDFTALLKAAREQAEATLAELALTQALLPALSPPTATVAMAAGIDAAPVGATPASPAPAPVVDGIPSAVQKSLDASAAEVARLREDVRKATAATQRAEAQAATLRATIGSSSALPSGEVSRLAKATGDRAEDRALWTGDLTRLADTE